MTVFSSPQTNTSTEFKLLDFFLMVLKWKRFLKKVRLSRRTLQEKVQRQYFVSHCRANVKQPCCCCVWMICLTAQWRSEGPPCFSFHHETEKKKQVKLNLSVLCLHTHTKGGSLCRDKHKNTRLISASRQSVFLRCSKQIIIITSRLTTGSWGMFPERFFVICFGNQHVRRSVK